MRWLSRRETAIIIVLISLLARASIICILNKLGAVCTNSYSKREKQLSADINQRDSMNDKAIEFGVLLAIVIFQQQ